MKGAKISGTEDRASELQFVHGTLSRLKSLKLEQLLGIHLKNSTGEIDDEKSRICKQIYVEY